MNLLIFGATGGTGRKLVEVALAKGHSVVAVARRPEAVGPRERLRVLKGDVLDPASIAATFAGVDAVVSTIGPTNNREPGTLLSEGTRNMLAGCTAAGVRRFVFESGLMCSDGSELSWFGALGLKVFRSFYPKFHADKLLAEKAIQESSLDWVIVRPPVLNHASATGKYRAGPHARIAAALPLSHADCADCLLRAVSEPQWVRQLVNVGR